MTRLTHEPNPFIAQHPHLHVPLKPPKFPSAQSSEKSSHRISPYGYQPPFGDGAIHGNSTPNSGRGPGSALTGSFDPQQAFALAHFTLS